MNHIYIYLGQVHLKIEIKANRNDNKNKQMGPNKTYKFLHSKGNPQENEKKA